MNTTSLYRDIRLSIDGKSIGRGEMVVEGNARIPDRFSLADAAGNVYEATAETTIGPPEPDELDDLVWQAAATPSLGATEALDVLIDALIERGRFDSPLQTFFTPDAWARRRREAAWDWVQERTVPPFTRMMNAFAKVFPAPEAVSGVDLSRVASLYGLDRMSNFGEAESDDELRTRLKAVWDR